MVGCIWWDVEGYSKTESLASIICCMRLYKCKVNKMNGLKGITRKNCREWVQSEFLWRPNGLRWPHSVVFLFNTVLWHWMWIMWPLLLWSHFLNSFITFVLSVLIQNCVVNGYWVVRRVIVWILWLQLTIASNIITVYAASLILDWSPKFKVYHIFWT